MKNNRRLNIPFWVPKRVGAETGWCLSGLFPPPPPGIHTWHVNTYSLITLLIFHESFGIYNSTHIQPNQNHLNLVLVNWNKMDFSPKVVINSIYLVSYRLLYDNFIVVRNNKLGLWKTPLDNTDTVRHGSHLDIKVWSDHS